MHKSYSWIPNEKISNPLFKWCILAQESKHCLWSMERMSWVSSTKVNTDSMSPYKCFCFSFSTACCQRRSIIFFSGCYLTLWSLMRIISVLWWTMNGSCCVRSLFPLSVASLGSFWPVCSSNFVVPSVQATVRWDSLGTCWENNHVFLTHHLEWSRNSLHYFIWAWNCLNASTVMTWSFTVCIYKSWPAVQCSVLD